MLDVTNLVTDARRTASTMSPADAAIKTIMDAGARGNITFAYPDAGQLVRALNTGHPDRASLQCAASSASTQDEFRDVMTKALTAIISTPALSSAVA